MTKTKTRSLRFAVSGLLLASAPMLGCKDRDTPVNEPFPEHTINEPPQPEPPPVPPTVNEPPQPEVEQPTINEPAPSPEPAPTM
jgi:hypothetical protein